MYARKSELFMSSQALQATPLLVGQSIPGPYNEHNICLCGLRERFQQLHSGKRHAAPVKEHRSFNIICLPFPRSTQSTHDPNRPGRSEVMARVSPSRLGTISSSTVPPTNFGDCITHVVPRSTDSTHDPNRTFKSEVMVRVSPSREENVREGWNFKGKFENNSYLFPSSLCAPHVDGISGRCLETCLQCLKEHASLEAKPATSWGYTDVTFFFLHGDASQQHPGLNSLDTPMGASQLIGIHWWPESPEAQALELTKSRPRLSKHAEWPPEF